MSTATGTPTAPPELAGGFLGVLPDLRRGPLGVAARALREGGDVTALVLGPPGLRFRRYAVYSPEGARRVLQEGAERYTKDTPGYRQTSLLLGWGLLTSEGEVWRRQRRFVAPLFTRRRLDAEYAPLVAEEAERLVARWRGLVRAGASTVDAHDEATRFTLQVIGRVLFGNDLEAVLPVLRRAFPVVSRGILRRTLTPAPLPLWAPLPTTRALARARAELRGTVDRLVDERRRSGLQRDDLLGRLLGARDPETGAGLDPHEVRDQLLVFLLAGHETTATTVAATLHLLATHPEAQERVRAEADAAAEPGESAESAEPAGTARRALPADRLPWTVQVVSEALRLHPPVWVIPRTTPVGDEVAGAAVPPGATLVVHVWGIHHNPRVWPDPERFDPERFAPEAVAARDRHAWIPFGAGARACIGAQLALLEAPLAVAAVTRAFRISADPGAFVTTAGLTLRPAGPVPVRLDPR